MYAYIYPPFSSSKTERNSFRSTFYEYYEEYKII